MELFEIVDKESCRSHITGKTKEDIVMKLAEVAAGSDRLKGIKADYIYQKIMERENQGSTGFGNGVALPHARLEGVDSFLIFIVVSKRGVEFEAIDKKKVNVFFVILGPEKEVSAHLKLLATISRVLSNSNVKRELLNARTSEAIYEAFMRNTRMVEKKGAEKQKMKLLFVILYFDEFLYHILEFFIEEGIDGATIIDSFGMGEYISNIPLFADFIGFMSQKKNNSKTIMALVPEDDIPEIIKGIEEITGDLDKKEGAVVFTLDVGFYKGSMRMM